MQNVGNFLQQMVCHAHCSHLACYEKYLLGHHYMYCCYYYSYLSCCNFRFHCTLSVQLVVSMTFIISAAAVTATTPIHFVLCLLTTLLIRVKCVFHNYLISIHTTCFLCMTIKKSKSLEQEE